MALPFALMAAGTALQVFGQYSANMAQAKAEIQNAKFYEEQAGFVKEAMVRESQIAATQYEMRKGAQLSAYAKAGVNLSGSAALVVASTIADKVSELNAIKRKGQQDFMLAKLRQHQSEKQADTLSDPFNNFLQAGGTILTNLARATDNNPKSPASKSLLGNTGGSTTTMATGNSGFGGYNYSSSKFGLGGDYSFGGR